VRQYDAQLKQNAPDGIFQALFGEYLSRFPGTLIEDASGRRLISKADLRELDPIWTIDSRDADLALLLSLDLGREISLTQLIGNIDNYENIAKFLPFLCEGTKSLSMISDSHGPVQVIVNSEIPRAAVRWNRGSALADILDVTHTSQYRSMMAARQRAQNQRDLRGHFVVYPVDLQCKASSLDVVASHFGTFVRNGSEIHILWSNIRRIVMELFASNAHETTLRAGLQLAQALFERMVGRQHLAGEWNELVTQLRVYGRISLAALPSDLSGLPVHAIDLTPGPRNWNR